jgi:release factor glutamine methyltransferase
VIREALDFLKPGGWLAFEFGEGQGRQLELLFKRAGAYETPQLKNDETGSPRVVAARRKPSD